VEVKFRKPLRGYAFPPSADVCFEGKCCSISRPSVDQTASRSTFNPYVDLQAEETNNHQEQVKALIEKTASSLDDTALKMMFVSVQQNNIQADQNY
jgi:hypothetical protein